MAICKCGRSMEYIESRWEGKTKIVVWRCPACGNEEEVS